MIRKFLPLVLLLLVGCAPGFYGQGRRAVEQGEYDRAIDAFYREIAVNPQSAAAWRELGVAFYEKGDLVKAEDALKQASAIRPDARGSLYLGLVFEKQQLYDPAIEAYRSSLSLRPRGETSRMIRAHLDHLIGRKVRQEVTTALENEAAINVADVPENTVAVMDFDASYLDPAMQPLATGLAEFTAIDLAKVKSLRVVDRLKIDAILDELELSRSGMVDQTTAPRMGRLLGSRHLVTGTVLGVGETELRLDGVIVNTIDSSSALTEPYHGELQKFFQVEKALVFGVLDSLGITLTVEERDAISEVPTESYLAFLAYSRGLQMQRQGLLTEARAAFDQAAKEDPGFGDARTRGRTVSADLSVGGGDVSLSDLEASAERLDGTSESGGGLDSRLVRTAQSSDRSPDLSQSGAVTSPPTVDLTATVRIRGDLDAN